jgi:predicted membrane chloride channel (bestrophin family)
VPFPFPHDQATVFFTFVSLFVFPVLFAGYVNKSVVACVLNFITIICFVGTHEVARELSDPYYTFPNDLPLNNFQTQVNEALICMWAGFHPDSWRAEPDNDSGSSARRSKKTTGPSRIETPLNESFGDKKEEEKTYDA